METGPRSEGRLPKPTTGPQSGVFSSSIGGETAGTGPTGPAPLQLTYLPLAGGESVIRVRAEGILTLRGRPLGSDPLRDLLGPLCYGHTVVLSLEKVVGAETSGVSWLYQTGERFAAGGGRVAVYAVPPQVRSLFELLGMELPFRIAVTESEARAAVAGPSPAA